MRRRPLVILTCLAVLAVSLTGCASGASAAGTTQAPAGRSNPDVITSD